MTLAWLVRRELWENKSLYIAPLVVVALFVLGFVFGSDLDVHIELDAEADLSAAAVHEIEMLKRLGPLLIAIFFFVVMLIVIGFYLLDSLYADRRDRSILFWKSLPVSDIETVLSKLAIAMVYFPLIVLVASVVTTAVGVGVLSLRYAATGHDAQFFSEVPILQSSLVVAYALLAQSLWYFPIFAYLLLVSAWARRSVFLWAVLPIAGIMLAEHLLFRSEYFGELIAHRFVAWFPLIFGYSDEGYLLKGAHHFDPSSSITELIDPTPMFTTSGLWVGLLVGAAFMAGAVWLRRYRDET